MGDTTASPMHHRTVRRDSEARSGSPERWLDGALGGAWDYEATRLTQYGTSSVNSTTALRCSAVEMANVLLALVYVQPGPVVDTPAECYW
jgi:hypothetical protein